MKKISVIIPAYNEEENLPKIISSLRNQVNKNFEIIIIDNNSSDKTFEIAKGLADKVFICKTQGFVFARNLGARKSKNEIVAFLDADSIPPKNWTEVISYNFEKNKSLDAVSCVGVYDNKGFFGWFFANSFTWIVFGICKISTWIGNSQLIANNLAIKRDLFLKVGGFDNFVVEDYYLSKKLNALGNVKTRMDSKMRVVYSARRLEKEGLLKMILFWTSSIFKKKSLDKYKSHDEL